MLINEFDRVAIKHNYTMEMKNLRTTEHSIYGTLYPLYLMSDSDVNVWPSARMIEVHCQSQPLIRSSHLGTAVRIHLQDGMVWAAYGLAELLRHHILRVGSTTILTLLGFGVALQNNQALLQDWCFHSDCSHCCCVAEGGILLSYCLAHF